ncbi:Uncharacterized protein TCM_029668 [Theobroma cacao]|uniref:Uncharacterized protein n=1 Tax=Theobroma cacao TaxID=3641 RepID=A0A061GEF4_THECC|nr:Uncharacterized protein TCM_029668 [Theobroma cacao]
MILSSDQVNRSRWLMLPSEQWPMHVSVTSWLLILFSFWVQWPTFPTLPIVH